MAEFLSPLGEIVNPVTSDEFLTPNGEVINETAAVSTGQPSLRRFGGMKFGLNKSGGIW
jgi:hypothetical protein